MALHDMSLPVVLSPKLAFLRVQAHSNGALATQDCSKHSREPVKLISTLSRHGHPPLVSTGQHLCTTGQISAPLRPAVCPDEVSSHHRPSIPSLIDRPILLDNQTLLSAPGPSTRYCLRQSTNDALSGQLNISRRLPRSHRIPVCHPLDSPTASQHFLDLTIHKRHRR